MNTERYPWLLDLDSETAEVEIRNARTSFVENGVFLLPEFLTPEAASLCSREAKQLEGSAYTTDDTHTAYLRDTDPSLPADSIFNLKMRTKVASVAFDELPNDGCLVSVYESPILLQLISKIVEKRLYLSEDPLGCCSVNVFRPGYHHSFHFDESQFSTTLMLQEADDVNSGLFQYTQPLRQSQDDLARGKVANIIGTYDGNSPDVFAESRGDAPRLHTLEFRPGTLSLFSGSKSLHRVTQVKGDRSRLVAVLTFGTEPGFRNSEKVQNLFWGRSKT